MSSAVLMRCTRTTCVTSLALLIVMMLVGVPTDGFTQSFVCHAPRPGESPTQAARRLTGDGRNAYQTWFQIMDRSSRFVPKSQYSRLRIGWRGCVISPTTLSPSSQPKHEVLAAAMPFPIASTGDGANAGPQGRVVGIPGRLGGADLTMLCLCVAIVVPWFGWRLVDGYLARRKTAAIVVEHFVHRFVDEFQRPLVRYDPGERPLKSRVRLGVRRGRFEILLAPGEGRRYPNLSDHRKNVEYDVARVMRVLADDAFVSGAPYTHARWIVVPFRFTSNSKQSGVACISSL